MKRRSATIGVVIFLAIPSKPLLVQGGQGKATPRYSVNISAPGGQAKVGSKLDLKIGLTNLLDKDLLIYTSGRGERDYTIRVLDKDEREPVETRYLRAVKGKDTSDPVSKTELVIVGGGGFHGIRPKESFQLTIDLNDLYVFKPGQYTVQVERLDEEGKILIKSNTITVTVIR